MQKRYAETLIESGNNEEAKLILEETLNWYFKNYGESYPDNGFVHLALAKCQLQLHDIYNCLNNLNAAGSLLGTKYGNSNSSVLEAILLLCNIIQGILAEQTDLSKTGFSEEENTILLKLYNASINNLDWGFCNNFENIKMNFGL